jgi:hypothetical protein
MGGGTVRILTLQFYRYVRNESANSLLDAFNVGSVVSRQTHYRRSLLHNGLHECVSSFLSLSVVCQGLSSQHRRKACTVSRKSKTCVFFHSVSHTLLFCFVHLLPHRTSSREALCTWLCEQHNIVNQKLGKPQYACDIKTLDERWRKSSKDACQSGSH